MAGIRLAWELINQLLHDQRKAFNLFFVHFYMAIQSGLLEFVGL